MKAEGGLDGTMAKVMNLVHDLILRRDVMRTELLKRGKANPMNISESQIPFQTSLKPSMLCAQPSVTKIKLLHALKYATGI